MILLSTVLVLVDSARERRRSAVVWIDQFWGEERTSEVKGVSWEVDISLVGRLAWMSGRERRWV